MCIGAGTETRREAQRTVDELVTGVTPDIPAWHDLDTVIEEYCATKGLAVPDDPFTRMELHIHALDEWLHMQRSLPTRRMP
jgi:hypothetical protein